METKIQPGQASTHNEGCIQTCRSCSFVFWSLTPRFYCDACEWNFKYDVDDYIDE